MKLSIGNLLEAALLIFNAMAILNEKRFLSKRTNPPPDYSLFYKFDKLIGGWHVPNLQASQDTEGASFLKNQIIILLYSARTYGRCNIESLATS